MNTLVYRIKRKSDGLYSTGGSCPRFTKKGKTWSSIGNLKNHLNMVGNSYHNPISNQTNWRASGYDNCEIEVFQVVHAEYFHSLSDDLLKQYKPK